MIVFPVPWEPVLSREARLRNFFEKLFHYSEFAGKPMIAKPFPFFRSPPMPDAVVEKRQRGRPRNAAAPPEAGVQSLDRAFLLLELVAAGNGLSLTEVAEAASLPPSTCYRILATLQRHGMVEFETGPQLWHVGVECFRIGSAFLRRRKIAERGRDNMQALVDRCGETANLAISDEDSVVFVSQVETHEPIRAFFRPGTRSPIHASGIGKAILAQWRPERVARLVAQGLARFTPNTLTDGAALAAELEQTRARGWALDDEERNPGMRCVAAAIFNEFGEPVAGISISGPTVRLTPELAQTFGPLVQDAAADVTRSIAGVLPARSA
jgi:IclR family acetate operon transcriptional repressor